MNKNVVLFGVALLTLLPQIGQADGGMFPRRDAWERQRERSLINEPSQKAAIFYRNGQERLIISPSYQGPLGDFAWVVPVPRRPQVKIVTGALFHELARIVEPRPPARHRFMGAAGTAKAMARPPVIVLERKVVGAYDVSVLSASDGAALQIWLDRNGYFMPGEARRPLAEYVREKWTFVACRVKTPGNARGLQSGTLAPLSLTFPSDKIIYPMRLSAVNPRSFSLVLYLLRPGEAEAAEPMPETWPGGSPPQLQIAHTFLAAGHYPTLAGLGAKSLDIRWFHTTFAPENSTRDFVWRAGNRRLYVK